GYVLHAVNVRSAGTDVDDPAVAPRQPRSDLLEQGHLAVAGRDALDRLDLARRGVVAEPRPEDVIWRDDAVQRRLDHFLGSRGNDVEREVVPVHFAEQAGEQAQVLLQTNPLAHFDQVLFSHLPVLRVVQQ